MKSVRAGIAAWAGRLGMAISSVAICLALLEASVRLFPALLPSGTYVARQGFDRAIQAAVYRGPVVYNKVRRVVRHPNSLGFLDVEPPDPRAGRARVGVFGDSYVEAAQVELPETFFRRLDDALPEADVMAFGHSGWGTLQSMLAWQGLAEPFALDVAVYVFVENDPGDNAWSIQRSGGSYLPRSAAVLAPGAPGYEIRWIEGNASRAPIRAARTLYERSRVLQAIWGRIALLRHFGLASRAAEDAREMTTRAGEIPTQNDLPSSWPAPYADEARQLGERILSDWKSRARARGQALVVAYVPRGEAQLRGELSDESTWKPWLVETCRQLELPLVDLTPALAELVRSGKRAYDDHWSPEGHAVVARALAHGLREWVARVR